MDHGKRKSRRSHSNTVPKCPFCNKVFPDLAISELELHVNECLQLDTSINELPKKKKRKRNKNVIPKVEQLTTEIKSEIGKEQYNSIGQKSKRTRKRRMIDVFSNGCETLNEKSITADLSRIQKHLPKQIPQKPKAKPSNAIPANSLNLTVPTKERRNFAVKSSSSVKPTPTAKDLPEIPKFKPWKRKKKLFLDTISNHTLKSIFQNTYIRTEHTKNKYQFNGFANSAKLTNSKWKVLQQGKKGKDRFKHQNTKLNRNVASSPCDVIDLTSDTEENCTSVTQDYKHSVASFKSQHYRGNPVQTKSGNLIQVKTENTEQPNLNMNTTEKQSTCSLSDAAKRLIQVQSSQELRCYNTMQSKDSSPDFFVVNLRFTSSFKSLMVAIGSQLCYFYNLGDAMRTNGNSVPFTIILKNKERLKLGHYVYKRGKLRYSISSGCTPTLWSMVNGKFDRIEFAEPNWVRN